MGATGQSTWAIFLCHPKHVGRGLIRTEAAGTLTLTRCQNLGWQLSPLYLNTGPLDKGF